MWLDIIEMDKRIECDDNIVEIQALAINIPECVDGEDNDYDDYVEDISRYVPSERQLPCEAHAPKSSTLTQDERAVGSSSAFFSSDQPGSRNTSSSSSAAVKPISALKNFASTVKSTATNLNLDSVKSGATSFWNKMKATAAQIQQQVTTSAATSSEDPATVKAAADMLAVLSKDVNTTYAESSAFHVQLLQRLWEVLFPDRPFQRTSATWKLAGWQKEDPIADLKNSGLLAIHCMIYLGDVYPEHTQHMIQTHMPNKKNNYPFAIVGVNVTLLLADLLKLRDAQLPTSREPYGPLFADPYAFSEIFCLCFMHIDAVWMEKNAVRTDFGKIIGELKAFLVVVLGRGPKTMEEFRAVAGDAGMKVM
eukprot:CAMPEP_0170403724 /NCGR_PEP_ID=MMETSP0117_2-20130122/26252_1 /TAXON_ID=400756 /ORGANISM="Durinskia baltica, Strain CSIRO CS-38" /LENGTH=364 /DNA_ID=CAMNT_0010660695 /DNA_START=216 /DNA_END=1310 /DNA_ORIENTATION=-